MFWHHAPFTKEDVVPQTVDRKTLRSWTEELDALGERIAPYFSRSEVRRRARDYGWRGLSGEEPHVPGRLREDGRLRCGEREVEEHRPRRPDEEVPCGRRLLPAADNEPSRVLRPSLQETLGWISNSELKLTIGVTYPLEKANDAHADLEGRKTTGKLLLQPVKGWKREENIQ